MSIDANEDVKMKCDELKAYSFYVTVDDDIELHNEAKSFYSKDDVDAAIAELKAMLDRSDKSAIGWNKKWFESEAKLRKTQRALWMARHERACAVAQWHLTLSEYEEANKWDKVVQKTLAKAKEYE